MNETPQAERNLERIGFVATPKDFDEILAYTRNASTPADATVAAMMAWNLAAKYAKKEHAHAETPSLEPCTTCVELVRKIFKEMDPAQQYKLAATEEFTAFARAFEGLI